MIAASKQESVKVVYAKIRWLQNKGYVTTRVIDNVTSYHVTPKGQMYLND